MYASDHLTTEHERFEQFHLTPQLSLNDDPHLWNKPATHNPMSDPPPATIAIHTPATSVVMASTSGVGSLARVKPPGIAMTLQLNCTVSIKFEPRLPSTCGISSHTSLLHGLGMRLMWELNSVQRICVL